jgi:ribosome-binding factor A
MEKLNRFIYEIQQLLNKQLKIRPVPKIRFIHDKNPEEAAEVEKLIEEAKHEIQK